MPAWDGLKLSARPTATQKEVDGQETPAKLKMLPGRAFADQLAPPSVVARMALPPRATQSADDAHETAMRFSPPWPVATVRFDQLVPAFVVVRMAPPPTATQADVVGQETARRFGGSGGNEA
jgi:hypothetical protein